MSEFLGLAYFAEIPVVLVNVQRGGPSTGMPTGLSRQIFFLRPMHPTAIPSTYCYFLALRQNALR